MTRAEIEAYIAENLKEEMSAPQIQYVLNLQALVKPSMRENQRQKYTEEDQRIEEQIRQEKDPEKLVNWMRKNLSSYNTILLEDKLLEMEEQVADLIKEKAMTNRQPVFIERAASFLVRRKEDPCSWIMENYDSFLSDYMKSLACLAIGFRGTMDDIPFLVDASDNLKKEHPGEDLEQGPIHGMVELYRRFIYDSEKLADV